MSKKLSDFESSNKRVYVIVGKIPENLLDKKDGENKENEKDEENNKNN